MQQQGKRDNNGFNMFMLSNGQMNVNLQQVNMVKGPMRVRAISLVVCGVCVACVVFVCAVHSM
jgi:hypothetical protein